MLLRHSTIPFASSWLRWAVVSLVGFPLTMSFGLVSPAPLSAHPQPSRAVAASADPVPSAPGRKSPAPGRKSPAPEARAVASAWLDRYARRPLALRASLAESAFVLRASDTPGGRVSQFTLQGSGWWLSLAFRGEVGASTTLAELRRRFWFATLERMPTPGLEVPGWEIQPLLPVSSIEEGVEILGFGRGRLQVRLRTTLFALLGRDPAILIPADAPAPPTAYFRIPRPVALDLTVAAPLHFP